MTIPASTQATSVPSWRRIPADRRRRLAVLIGQLAWRCLDPDRTAAVPVLGGEDAHDRPDDTGQDPRQPP
jgi:hypothetical protein